MAKRPTPKKRLPKDRSRRRHSAYIVQEVRRLENRATSPYGTPARKKSKGDKALEKITRVKA